MAMDHPQDGFADFLLAAQHDKVKRRAVADSRIHEHLPGLRRFHANVLDHCRMLQNSCDYNEHSVTVTWMPYYHDYGLVEGLLEPLYNGTPCIVLSPVAFIKRPLLWLEAISRYQATHSQGPNFAYEHCVRRIEADQRSGLDLSHWRAAGPECARPPSLPFRAGRPG